MGLSNCRNISDLRDLARKKLPSPIYHYLEGGADDEWTLDRNVSAFNEIELIPKSLVDVSTIDTSTEIFGRRIDWPVMLAPTGMTRLFNQDGELAAARAAHLSGTAYGLSTLATTTIEDVGEETDGPKVFQVYVLKDRGLSRALMDRCKAAKFDALALTVDVPVAGNRERDLWTGMTMPPKLTASSMMSFASHPAWTLRYLAGKSLSMINLEADVATGSSDPSNIASFVDDELDHSVTWDDAAEMIRYWNGPFAIKGILSVGDALRAQDIGASTIVVSNHGGRQLDGTAAPIEVLGSIIDAVGGNLDVILESGVRRGSHVVKALAMGAKAVSVGRCYLYGISAGGEAGVTRALEILHGEVQRTLALIGCNDVKKINRSYLRKTGVEIV
jgi:L-lactate dehydrogenase (cytochrome)